MKKLRFILIWLLMLLSISRMAFAEAFSFPGAGVRIDMREGWTLVTRDTLDTIAGELARQGVDTKLLRIDMESADAVFAVFLPDGIRVMLSRHETEQTQAFRSLDDMSDADLESLRAAFDTAPYRRAKWWTVDVASVSYLGFDWAFQAAGEDKEFASAVTVWHGALYQLTATGAQSIDALYAANEQVLAALTMFPSMRAEDGQATIEVPAPIEDNGVVTPITLAGFTGITYEDLTELVIETLPGAEVVVITANDRLRAIADSDGRHMFRVSTRRETAYAYTIEVTAPGRTQSRMDINVERRLAPALQTEAYRKGARPLAGIGYEKLLSNPGDYADTAITFRGKVSHFSEREGIPCALVYTRNIEDDLWDDPLWMLLTDPMELTEGNIYTLYGDGSREVMLFLNEDGISSELPVLVCKSVVKE